MRSVIVGIGCVLLMASGVAAETEDCPAADPGRIEPTSCSGQTAVLVPLRSIVFPAALFQPQDAQPLHAVAVEHSDGYLLRAKIHKYSSFATLPLFATELALGQSLYNTPANAGGQRAAHGVVGAGIAALFGVNTVTGAWNLFGEGWSEKQGRTRRLVHGLLMMAADVGILATTATGPNSQGRRGALTFETDKVTHRNLAIASIGTGTAGYLMMLFWNH